MSDRNYSRHEELAHALTHGLGAVASLIGAPFLIYFAAASGQASHIVSAVLFGAALVILYAASTAYHSARPGRWQRRLHMLDHASIYLLIAGSYSPFLMVTFADSFGPLLMVLMWSLALLGVVFKLFTTGRYEKLSLAIYLLMGWAIVFVGPAVFERLPGPGLWLLVGGGLAYTVGAVFYAWQGLPYNHTIWHLFVITGSVLHYFAILLYVY